MVAVATTLWGLNGVISKVVLNHGISPAELTECRMLGAFTGLAAVLLLTQPQALRVTRREWPELIALGLIGLVGVQLLYLVALRTLPTPRARPPLKATRWAAIRLSTRRSSARLAQVPLSFREWRGLASRPAPISFRRSGCQPRASMRPQRRLA